MHVFDVTSLLCTTLLVFLSLKNPNFMSSMFIVPSESPASLHLIHLQEMFCFFRFCCTICRRFPSFGPAIIWSDEISLWTLIILAHLGMIFFISVSTRTISSSEYGVKFPSLYVA